MQFGIAVTNCMQENPVVIEFVKKFPTFYGTNVFLNMFTRVRRWAVSWAKYTEFPYSHPFPSRCILILYSSLRLRLSHKLSPVFRVSGYNSVRISLALHSFYMSHSYHDVHFICLKLWAKGGNLEVCIMQFSTEWHFLSLRPNILLSIVFLHSLSQFSFPRNLH
jgi:hypothetical protein